MGCDLYRRQRLSRQHMIRVMRWLITLADRHAEEVPQSQIPRKVCRHLARCRTDLG